jgi:hypothetical protein
LSNRNDQRAVGALAGDDGLAMLATLQHSVESIEMEVPSRAVAAVASQASGLEQRADVFLKGHVLHVGQRRQFALVGRCDFRCPIDVSSSGTRDAILWAAPLWAAETANAGWCAGNRILISPVVPRRACGRRGRCRRVRRLFFLARFVIAASDGHKRGERYTRPIEAFAHLSLLAFIADWRTGSLITKMGAKIAKTKRMLSSPPCARCASFVLFVLKEFLLAHFAAESARRLR